MRPADSRTTDAGIMMSWDSAASATYTIQWSTDHHTWHNAMTGVGSGGTTTSMMLPDTFDVPFVVFRVLEE